GSSLRCGSLTATITPHVLRKRWPCSLQPDRYRLDEPLLTNRTKSRCRSWTNRRCPDVARRGYAKYFPVPVPPCLERVSLGAFFKLRRRFDSRANRTINTARSRAVSTSPWPHGGAERYAPDYATQYLGADYLGQAIGILRSLRRHCRTQRRVCFLGVSRLPRGCIASR